MVDHVTPDVRSQIMQAIGTRNTSAEMRVRRMLHRSGYRYALHRKDLPGRPDIVFPSRRKVIFVHGCFWHGHGCRWGRLPKSRLDYWGPKIQANAARDVRNETALAKLGWTIIIIWQCELRDPEQLFQRITRFLKN